jgi:signal transduction histidine kinase
MPQTGRGGRVLAQARARLFSAVALLAVAAVNVAGLWAIAAARRDAVEEAGRLLRAETQARVRAFESRLLSTRADLTFLAESPLLEPLLVPSGSDTAAERASGRQAAEAALLLFLRGHPEVTRLTVRGRRGEPRSVAGRRGGVPLLWVASSPTGEEGPAVAPGYRSLEAVAPIEASPSGPAPAALATLTAEAQPSLLLTTDDAGEQAGSPSCRLVAGPAPVARPPSSAGQLEASADIATEGWRTAARWSLSCDKPEVVATAPLAPLSTRYRTTLAFNLAAMALALLLGLLVVREVRQRERLEARAHEEARVRDLERQLFHAERLTSLGRLVAGLAHEINNPLEGMANYLTLARDALERGETEQARRRLEGVRQGLERAALVVRQALAHAEPGAAPKGPVDLNQVVTETTDFVRSRPEFRVIRFEAALENAAVVVEGNAIMLSQVVLNLLVNACEAQPDGGEVTVSSRRSDRTVAVEVADRGPGIPAADLERIFEPFFSTKASSGLGLSVCHAIVRQHGGEIVALPREGGGTILRMTLPAGIAHTEAA